MADDDRIEQGSKDRPPPTFLVGNGPMDLRRFPECQFSTIMHGYSLTLERSVVVAITCKQWSCRSCGQAKVRRLGAMAKAAKPTKFITLTVDNKLYETPREAFDKTRRQVNKIAAKIRKLTGECEYMRVLEVTKKGWPHYHLVARCGFVKQADLSNWWAELTGAPIVDIRKIKRTEDVYFYVVKYLSKQAYIEWTTRRVTLSRHFIHANDETETPTLNLIDVKREQQTVESFLHHQCQGQVMEQISPLVFGWIGPPHPPKLDAQDSDEFA